MTETTHIFLFDLNCILVHLYVVWNILPGITVTSYISLQQLQDTLLSFVLEQYRYVLTDNDDLEEDGVSREVNENVNVIPG